jgi:hypothetical protein
VESERVDTDYTFTGLIVGSLLGMTLVVALAPDKANVEPIYTFVGPACGAAMGVLTGAALYSYIHGPVAARAPLRGAALAARLRALTTACTPEENDRFALLASYEGRIFLQSRDYLPTKVKKPLSAANNIELRRDLAQYEYCRTQLTKSAAFQAYHKKWAPGKTVDAVLEGL